MTQTTPVATLFQVKFPNSAIEASKQLGSILDSGVEITYMFFNALADGSRVLKFATRNPAQTDNILKQLQLDYEPVLLYPSDPPILASLHSVFTFLQKLSDNHEYVSNLLPVPNSYAKFCLGMMIEDNNEYYRLINKLNDLFSNPDTHPIWRIIAPISVQLFSFQLPSESGMRSALMPIKSYLEQQSIDIIPYAYFVTKSHTSRKAFILVSEEDSPIILQAFGTGDAVKFNLENAHKVYPNTVAMEVSRNLSKPGTRDSFRFIVEQFREFRFDALFTFPKELAVSSTVYSSEKDK